MSEGSAPLVLDGLSHGYQSGESRLEVLRGAGLVLQPGEIVALMAPSGTGKSTLLHLAGLLERPQAGAVLVDGCDSGRLSDGERTAIRLRAIGFVYQFHHLLAEFTARENVVLPQMIASTARRQAALRADRLLGAFGLSHRLDHLPGARRSGWRSPAPWPIARVCCWPTSRPATSMPQPRPACSTNCCAWSARRGWQR